MEFHWYDWIIFILGGFVAGIINTLAGNGSAITLTLLISLGMDATVANATNRIGVLMQTFTGVAALKRTKRVKMLIGDSVWFFVPTIIGSLLGAYLAIGFDPKALEYIIGGVMVILLITMVFDPKRWLIATDTTKHKKTALNWFIFFAIGLYGGFIQMGIGIMMLAALVLSAKYSLRDGNIIKLVLAFVLIAPAFVIYLLSGIIVWIPGIALAIGAVIGAWFGARYVLDHPKANAWIRYLLIIILISAILKIFAPLVWHTLA